MILRIIVAIAVVIAALQFIYYLAARLEQHNITNGLLSDIAEALKNNEAENDTEQ